MLRLVGGVHLLTHLRLVLHREVGAVLRQRHVLRVTHLNVLVDIRILLMLVEGAAVLTLVLLLDLSVVEAATIVVESSLVIILPLMVRFATISRVLLPALTRIELLLIAVAPIRLALRSLCLIGRCKTFLHRNL